MLDAQTSQRPPQASARQPEVAKTGDHLPLDAWIAATLIAILLAWFKLANPYGKVPTRLWLAMVVTAVGVAPLLLWMRNPRRGRLPVFQLHCVFYAFSFGLVGFLDDVSTLNRDVSETYMQAAQWAALLALTSLIGGFYVAGHLLGKRLPPCRAIMPVTPGDLGWIAWGLYPLVVLLALRTRVLAIPYVSQSFTGLQDFLFLFLTTCLVAGAWRSAGRLLYVFIYLPLLLLVGIAAGNISSSTVPAMLVCMLYMSFRRRVPWVFLALIAACFVILQPVKGAYRQTAWRGEASLGVLEGAKMFFSLGYEELFGNQVSGRRVALTEAMEKTFARMNHLHVTGAVIEDTPSVEPFLKGQTYLPLLTKWIPRAVWSNKPQERLGNEWAQRYGYLGEEDFGTSFNLPWLTEMFINFGWLGVFGIHLAVGFGFRALHQLFLDRPVSLADAAFGLTITAALVIVESNLSLLIGRWAISMISLMAFAVVLRSVRRAPNQEPVTAGGKRRVSNAPRRSGNDDRGLVARSQRMP